MSTKNLHTTGKTPKISVIESDKYKILEYVVETYKETSIETYLSTYPGSYVLR